MNLKKRLIISNTVTVIIPLVITIMAAVIFSFIYSIANGGDISYSSFRELIMIRSELVSASSISTQNAINFEEGEIQQYLARRLSGIKGEVIITKNYNILFASKDINKIDIEKCMEVIRAKSLKKEVKLDNILYAVEGAPLIFKDGTPGTLILLAPLGAEVGILEKFIICLIIIFILSFVAVNSYMSYQFSKRILKPVAQLKNAATEISNGNLNCEIIEDGDEEIRELCCDFENMRIQLKDSIRMRMKYDDNRKMLVSSISHDLKTPITSIKGYVEGILDGVANTPEKMERYLKTIYSKAEMVDVMIDDLLLYSKLDLNQLPFNFEETDISEFFKDCIYESAAEFEKSNISINFKNNLGHSSRVMIDRDRMKRVIMNIMDNSRKYMDKSEGKITIALRETNSSIIAELRDNGCGIKEGDINKIFDRFYRVDSARTETKGSGLGLAIAKQIVEGHKGKIWAVNHKHEGISIMISLAKGN